MTRTYEVPDLLNVGPIATVVLGPKDPGPIDKEELPEPELTWLDED